MNLQTILDYLFDLNYHPNEVAILGDQSIPGQTQVQLDYAPRNSFEMSLQAISGTHSAENAAEMRQNIPALRDIQFHDTAFGDAYTIMLDDAIIRQHLLLATTTLFRQYHIDLSPDALAEISVENGPLHRGQEVFLERSQIGIATNHPGRITHCADDGDYEVRFVYDDAKPTMHVITTKFRREHLIPGNHWRQL